MARRKTIIEQARKAGDTLVLDAGNALFANAAMEDGPSRERAKFLLIKMGELGTPAMAVGARDLSAGVEFLQAAAAKSKVKLLSVNLAVKGKRLFDASTIVTVGKLRVGLIGVSPDGPFGPPGGGVYGQAPVATTLTEARALRPKVDLLIVLAAIPIADALQLSRDAGEAVDLILQSSESRPGVSPSSGGGALVLSTGERGRTLERISLELAGKGPLVDRSELRRGEQTLTFLDQQIQDTERRIAAATNADQKSSLQAALNSFQGRRMQTTAAMARLKADQGRGFDVAYVTLGTEVADDPALKRQVDAIAPTPSAH